MRKQYLYLLAAILAAGTMSLSYAGGTEQACTDPAGDWSEAGTGIWKQYGRYKYVYVYHRSESVSQCSILSASG